MENPDYVTVRETPNRPFLKTFRVFMGIIAVVLSIVMVALAIGWAASVIAVLVTDTMFGYNIFFGLQPVVLATLITATLYVAYWPIALIAKGFWSLAKGVNRYDHGNIVTGGILFALSIAALIIITLQFSKNIKLDYKDENVRVIVDDGTVCISKTNLCE